MLDYKHKDIPLDAGILCSTNTLECRIEDDFYWYLQDEDEDSPIHEMSVEQFTDYVMEHIDPKVFCNKLADELYEKWFWDCAMEVRDDMIGELVQQYMSELRSKE